MFSLKFVPCVNSALLHRWWGRGKYYLFDRPKTLSSPQEAQKRFWTSKVNWTISISFSPTVRRTLIELPTRCIAVKINMQQKRDWTTIQAYLYIAKLHAVYQSLSFIKQRCFRIAVICTDSRSVVQSLHTEHSSSSLLIGETGASWCQGYVGTELTFPSFSTRC